MTIPKIIHVTYKSRQLPPTYQACYEQLCHLHPDWQIRFWTDEELLAEMRGTSYWEAFQRLPRMIMRIDMFRYYLMWRYGGLYCDLDYYWLRPFDLQEKYRAVVPRNRDGGNSWGNCVFASEPGLPFWQLFLEDLQTCTERFALGEADAEVSDHPQGTGPGLVTRLMTTAPVEILAPVYSPPRAVFHPPTRRDPYYWQQLLQEGVSYGLHLCTGVWREGQL